MAGISVCVQTADFDLAYEQSLLRESAGQAGAIVSFTGVVREMVDNEALTAMVLEHYPAMTEAALHQIALQAVERWSLAGVRIIHRVGELLPNDQIVLVIVAAKHRGAAFAACEFVMDFLKTEAPFWKKEVFADGRAKWVDARESDELAKQRWQ